MNKQTLGIGLGGAVIGALLVLALYPVGSGEMGGGMKNVDAHFIEQMIPHHDGAIAMAKLALAEGTRAEIKSLAQGIVEAQERENKHMRAWYEEWFGGAPAAGHGGMHMDGMTGDLEALANAANFDVEFIDQMIPHHEMAVMMAQMLAAGTNRPEMKELADQIITSQSREIEMMRSWRAAW